MYAVYVLYSKLDWHRIILTLLMIAEGVYICTYDPLNFQQVSLLKKNSCVNKTLNRYNLRLNEVN